MVPLPSSPIDKHIKHFLNVHVIKKNISGKIYGCVNTINVICWTYDPVADSWSAPLPSSTYSHPSQSGKGFSTKLERKRKRETKTVKKNKEKER
jgi:hypothetical protein